MLENVLITYMVPRSINPGQCLNGDPGIAKPISMTVAQMHRDQLVGRYTVSGKRRDQWSPVDKCCAAQVPFVAVRKT